MKEQLPLVDKLQPAQNDVCVFVRHIKNHYIATDKDCAGGLCQ